MPAVVDARTLLAQELEQDEFREAFEDALSLDTLIDQLIELRHLRGVNQSQLAKSMGVGQSTVSGFETESTDPRISTLQRYARALNARVKVSLEVCGEAGAWRSAALHSWKASARSEGSAVCEVIAFPRHPWLEVTDPAQRGESRLA